jgi:hypothetical protein
MVACNGRFAIQAGPDRGDRELLARPAIRLRPQFILAGLASLPCRVVHFGKLRLLTKDEDGPPGQTLTRVSQTTNLTFANWRVS